MENTSQVLTLTDIDYGLAVTVTKVSKGYAVTFIDTEAEAVIASRVFSDKLRALSYAHGLVSPDAVES